MLKPRIYHIHLEMDMIAHGQNIRIRGLSASVAHPWHIRMGSASVAHPWPIRTRGTSAFVAYAWLQIAPRGGANQEFTSLGSNKKSLRGVDAPLPTVRQRRRGGWTPHPSN